MLGWFRCIFSFSRILDHWVLAALVVPYYRLGFSRSLRLKKALGYQDITFFLCLCGLCCKSVDSWGKKWVKYVWINQTPSNPSCSSCSFIPSKFFLNFFFLYCSKEALIRLTSGFSTETLEARSTGHSIFHLNTKTW